MLANKMIYFILSANFQNSKFYNSLKIKENKKSFYRNVGLLKSSQSVRGFLYNHFFELYNYFYKRAQKWMRLAVGYCISVNNYARIKKTFVIFELKHQLNISDRIRRTFPLTKQLKHNVNPRK